MDTITTVTMVETIIGIMERMIDRMTAMAIIFNTLHTIISLVVINTIMATIDTNMGMTKRKTIKTGVINVMTITVAIMLNN
jgi:hypothetical protein